MQLVALVLAALVLAACSPAQKQMLRERYNLIPPTLVTDARIDGQRITLNRGQALVVRLDEDPSTGNRWEMRPLTSRIVSAPVQHDLAARPATDPAAPTVPGEALFRLRGVEAGTQSIVLDYQRPLESMAAKSIRFDVVVR